jgi:hypothetical protein
MLGWVYDERTGWHFDEAAYARGRRVVVLGMLALIATVLAGMAVAVVELTASLSFGGGEDVKEGYGFSKTLGVFAVLLAVWSLATAYGVRAAGWTVAARCLPAVLSIGLVTYGWAAVDARASAFPSSEVAPSELSDIGYHSPGAARVRYYEQPRR